MCSSSLESYRFIGKPSDRLRCLICYDLAEIPLQHEDCGKVFCKVCINKNGDSPCPNCRSENRNYFIDRRCAQEIGELPVQCDNVENGCPWEGTLGSIETHVKTCTFVLVLCPNKCQSSGRILKESLDNHLQRCPNRAHTCKHCGESGTYVSITEEHEKVCQKIQVACVQCDLSVERGKIEEHKRVSCTHTVVPCKYESIGCCTRTLRKDMQQHQVEDNTAHFDVALEKLALLSERASTLKYGEFFAFKLSGFSRLKQAKGRFNSESFYTCQRYKMRVLVDCNGRYQAMGTHLSVSVEILEGRYDKELEWPFRGVVALVLLNQLADSCHAKQIVVMRPPQYSAQVGSVAGIWQFIPLSELSPQDLASKVRYLIDDTLHFRVKVDTLKYKPWLSLGIIDSTAMEITQDSRMVKKQGNFTVKFPNYSKASSVISEFFIEPGYTSGIVVSSINKHLSVIFVVSEHPFGHSLEEYSGTIHVELLNQLEDRNHYSKYLETFTRNTETASVVMKSAEFIPVATLSFNEDSHTQYLKDDCLFFRFSLNTEMTRDEKPWLESKGEFMKYYAITTRKS